jgi:hypothetical protein
MDQDTGHAEPRHDAMGQIAGALRGAAGKHHHVARPERRAHRQFERDVLVGERTERHRLAAGFDNRGGDDCRCRFLFAGMPAKAGIQ